MKIEEEILKELKVIRKILLFNHVHNVVAPPDVKTNWPYYDELCDIVNGDGEVREAGKPSNKQMVKKKQKKSEPEPQRPLDPSFKDLLQ